MRITHEKGLKVILEGQGADEALGGLLPVCWVLPDGAN